MLRIRYACVPTDLIFSGIDGFFGDFKSVPQSNTTRSDLLASRVHPRHRNAPLILPEEVLGRLFESPCCHEILSFPGYQSGSLSQIFQLAHRPSLFMYCSETCTLSHLL